jgi:hypothetical protein
VGQSAASDGGGDGDGGSSGCAGLLLLLLLLLLLSSSGLASAAPQVNRQHNKCELVGHRGSLLSQLDWRKVMQKRICLHIHGIQGMEMRKSTCMTALAGIV